MSDWEEEDAATCGRGFGAAAVSNKELDDYWGDEQGSNVGKGAADRQYNDGWDNVVEREGRGDRSYGGDGFNRGGRRNSETATRSALAIPDNFRRDTVEQFINSFEISAYKTLSEVQELWQYLVQALQVHVSREVENEQTTRRAQQVAATQPHTYSAVAEQMRAFINNSNEDDLRLDLIANCLARLSLQHGEEVPAESLQQQQADKMAVALDLASILTPDLPDIIASSDASGARASNAMDTSAATAGANESAADITLTQLVCVAGMARQRKPRNCHANVPLRTETAQQQPLAVMASTRRPAVAQNIDEAYMNLREQLRVREPKPIRPLPSRNIPTEAAFYRDPREPRLAAIWQRIFVPRADGEDALLAQPRGIEQTSSSATSSHASSSLDLAAQPVRRAMSATQDSLGTGRFGVAHMLANSNVSANNSNSRTNPFAFETSYLSAMLGGAFAATMGQSSAATTPVSNEHMAAAVLPSFDLSLLGDGATSTPMWAPDPLAMTAETPISSLGMSGLAGVHARSQMQSSLHRQRGLASILEEEAEQRRTFNQRLTAFDQNESQATAALRVTTEADFAALEAGLRLLDGSTQASGDVAMSAGLEVPDAATAMQPPLANSSLIASPTSRPPYDDYRRNWFAILRERQEVIDYETQQVPQARSRRRRRHRRNAAVATEDAAQVLAAMMPAALPIPTQQAAAIAELEDAHLARAAEAAATSTLLQQLSNSEPNQTPASAFSFTVSNNNETMQQQQQQQQHDDFLLQNHEAISLMMDHLPLVRDMLIEYNNKLIQRHAEEMAARGLPARVYPTLPARPTFDPDVLLNADPHKLAIYHGVLKALIMQPEVQLQRCEFIRSRIDAAIAFGFLLELKGDDERRSSRYNRDRSEKEGERNFSGGRNFGGAGRSGGAAGGGAGGGYGCGGARRRDSAGGDDFGNNNRMYKAGNQGGETGDTKNREFYIPPEPSTDEMEIFNSGISCGINFAQYEKIKVNVSGDDVPAAIKTFDDTNLREAILANVHKSGYNVPTPIQKVAIPVIGAGRDLMACAQTGSGKTAAFLLPILSNLLEESHDLEIGKPQAVVVSPTRELAVQIFNEARKFAHSTYLKISIVYGGTSFKYQNENVAKGCHMLIATPGRLMDFVNRTHIMFHDTRFVVLDEADRMLEMGFIGIIKQIMHHETMSQTRQTLMFSATFPEIIQRLAGEFLTDYVFAAIGMVGGACSDVKQHFVEVSKFSKRAKLLEILRDGADGTIVFVETKRGADFLASFFSETEFPTTSIHGDRLQSQREEALRDFKSGKMKVLIATSVAARGLDIKNVNHVINYDMPNTIDDYVHRIGRTGRVGNSGRATSLIDPSVDRPIATDLIRILEAANQEVPDFLREMSDMSGVPRYTNNPFGGSDVRSFNAAADGAADATVLEDECWD